MSQRVESLRALVPVHSTGAWESRLRDVERQLVRNPDVATTLGVHALGVAPLFNEPRLVEGGSHWVILPGDQDPLYKAGFPVPRAEAQRLHLFASAVDATKVLVYVAHELSASDYSRLARGHRVRVETLVPQRTRVERAERMAAVLGQAALAMSAVATAPLLLAGLAVAGAASAVAAGASVVTLDPVVLGAVPLGDDQDAPALWLALAEWRW